VTAVPAWAKTGVAVAGAVIVLIVVGVISDSGRRGATRNPSSSVASAPDLPPPAVDPRGLVGGWVFGTPDGAGGSSGFVMALNRDLTFGIEMMTVDAAGRTTPVGSLAGTWIVTGDRLVFTSAGGGRCDGARDRRTGRGLAHAAGRRDRHAETDEAPASIGGASEGGRAMSYADQGSRARRSGGTAGRTRRASAPSTFNPRVEPMQFHACAFSRELPVDFAAALVS